MGTSASDSVIAPAKKPVTVSVNPLIDPGEYSVNKQGRITGLQMELLQLTSNVTWVMMLISIVVIGGIAGFVVFKWMQTAKAIPAGVWLIFGLSIGIPVMYCLFRLLRNWNMKQDISAGIIAGAEGAVSWNGRRYVVDAPVSSLQSVHGPLEVLPGAYMYYYLPHARRLLSAQPLESRQQYIDNHRRVLNQVVGVADQALKQMNRGELSEPEVKRVEGEITKSFRYRTRRTVYEITCNNHVFPVSEKIYNALIEEQLYSLYYTATTETIVAAEPLG